MAQPILFVGGSMAHSAYAGHSTDAGSEVQPRFGPLGPVTLLVRSGCRLYH
ncbi:MAG: hypothetical protein QNJ61_03490 [Desulfobacterales bacterium]|nr:hypothetical protein [Desulfobacterales bacterium]